jgi:hypothetical protein
MIRSLIIYFAFLVHSVLIGQSMPITTSITPSHTWENIKIQITGVPDSTRNIVIRVLGKDKQLIKTAHLKVSKNQSSTDLNIEDLTIGKYDVLFLSSGKIIAKDSFTKDQYDDVNN